MEANHPWTFSTPTQSVADNERKYENEPTDGELL